MRVILVSLSLLPSSKNLQSKSICICLQPSIHIDQGTYTLFNATAHCMAPSPKHRLDKIRAWHRVEREMLRQHESKSFDLLHAFWGTAPGFIGTRIAQRLRIPSLVSLAGGELAACKNANYGAQLFRWSRLLVAPFIKKSHSFNSWVRMACSKSSNSLSIEIENPSPWS